ncbi:MAG: S41 family peptidase [Lachnospiraceae bacterium]
MKRQNDFWKGALIGALAMFIFVIAVVAGTGFVSGTYNFNGGLSKNNVVDRTFKNKINLMQSLIDKEYLYSVDQSKVKDEMYQGYIKGLNDPYADYYTTKEMKQLLESTSGEYFGIGAVMSQNPEDRVISISEVFENQPAAEAGLQNNDVIVSVDGQSVQNMDLQSVVSKIRGKKNTQVDITILREGVEGEQKVTATRRKILTPTVVSELKPNQIGYIRIVEFDTVTYNQFVEAFTTLQNQGMQGLVVDLRNNPGGNLDTVCDMLELLLPKGVMVYTEDKSGNKKEYSGNGNTPFTQPLCVLVNSNSASASEIFAGAIQDYGVGELVGTTTYGKGVVQQIHRMEDGSGMKFTVSQYFTPKGRNINKVGIKPDTVIEYQENKQDEKADNQLDKAMEIINSQITAS